MVKLSVIVPIYNSQKYLCECIESILRQEYDNLEIILVNDGSTDNSYEICKRYEENDKRIKVIDQNNRGIMLARLSGFRVSRGEYIGFVDSDDWIASDMYKKLMDVAEEKDCDIVSMGYTLVRGGELRQEDDATIFGLFEKGKNMNIVLSNMMYDKGRKRRGVHPALWSKVFRRTLLQTIYDNFKVHERITMGEDAAIFYPCCLKAKSVFIMKEYQYYYRIHSESTCRTMNINTFYEIHAFYRHMTNILLEFDQRYDLLKQLKQYVWSFVDSGLRQVFDIHIEGVYIFPYARIERNADIVIYGAGEVGQSYFQQILENHYCNIVAWADKEKYDGISIIHPEQIPTQQDIVIVIAVAKKEIAEKIMMELSGLGISREQMVWSIPQRINGVIS